MPIEKTIFDKKAENYRNKLMKKRLTKELLLIESVMSLFIDYSL